MEIKRIYTNNDFFRVIGKISIVFATMDFHVSQFLFRLMDAKKFEALKISDNTTLGAKLEKIKSLRVGKVDYPDALKKIKAILPRVIRVAKERNRYIHDLWLFNEGEIQKGKIERHRLTRKNEHNINVSKLNVENLKLNDLEKFCDEVIEVQDLICKIVSNIPAINERNIEM